MNGQLKPQFNLYCMLPLKHVYVFQHILTVGQSSVTLVPTILLVLRSLAHWITHVILNKNSDAFMLYNQCKLFTCKSVQRMMNLVFHLQMYTAKNNKAETEASNVKQDFVIYHLSLFPYNS